jgi:hypothetical protein
MEPDPICARLERDQRPWASRSGPLVVFCIHAERRGSGTPALASYTFVVT